VFTDRLAEAERRLTTAWDLDHDCEPAATAMVGVCMGLGKDRETMETWFRRAVAADPSRTEVFERKMQYLQPKWLGSAEGLVAFGRQAARLGAWDAALPMLLLQAHHDLAPPVGAKRDAYFRRAEVWADLGPVLEEIRKRHPKSPRGASMYLYFAWQCDENPAKALTYVRAQTVPLIVGYFSSPIHVDAALDWAKAKAESKD
jgi:hypothetical protein